MNRERIKKIVERQKADIKSILQSSEDSIKRAEQRIAEVKKEHKGSRAYISVVTAEDKKLLRTEKQWLNRYKKKLIRLKWKMSDFGY